MAKRNLAGDTPEQKGSGIAGGWLSIDKTQATIILCGLYLFFSLAGNIAATKVTYFGSLPHALGQHHAYRWRFAR